MLPSLPRRRFLQTLVGSGALIDQFGIPFLGRLFGKRGRYSNRYQLYLLADINIINYAELEAKL